jgi:hypothetical protein
MLTIVAKLQADAILCRKSMKVIGRSTRAGDHEGSVTGGVQVSAGKMPARVVWEEA